MKCLSLHFFYMLPVVSLPACKNTSEEKRGRESRLLLQTVPLKKSINAVFENPCSLMYRFVLLSVGFNLNMVHLYLTFSPSVSQSVSQSVSLCYTMLLVAFRKKPPFSLYVLV